MIAEIPKKNHYYSRSLSTKGLLEKLENQIRHILRLPKAEWIGVIKVIKDFFY
jgi:hypothetical protein